MKRTLTHVQRREMLLTLGLLGLGGCWGSFSLTGRVFDWNGSFGSKWASWAVFLVFIIIPVYGATLFIDAIVLNTIETPGCIGCSPPPTASTGAAGCSASGTEGRGHRGMGYAPIAGNLRSRASQSPASSRSSSWRA
jgi:hypothetical protein